MSSDDSSARTPAGDAFTTLVVQILRLNGHLTAAGDALARPAGQTSARWQVMGVVEHGLFLHMATRALISDGSGVRELLR